MDLVIMPTGEVRCIYDETIDLHQIGALAIRRASHVEPSDNGFWSADLSPVGGPVLGPFVGCCLELAAEQVWLSANWLCPQS